MLPQMIKVLFQIYHIDYEMLRNKLHCRLCGNAIQKYLHIVALIQFKRCTIAEIDGIKVLEEDTRDIKNNLIRVAFCGTSHVFQH